jgi:tetratricopeptide (TPR) repeat protein
MHDDQSQLFFEIILSLLMLFVFSGGVLLLVYLLPKRAKDTSKPDTYQQRKEIEDKKKKKKQSLARKAKQAAKVGGLKQAEAFLYQASGIDESDPKILEELSEVLLKQEKHEKRVLVLQKLAQVDPSDTQICFLGNAFYDYRDKDSTGEYLTKAQDCYSFVLDRSPESTVALLGLSRVAIAKEDYEQAFSYLKKAHQLDQSEREINFLLLFLYKEFGHTNSLRQHLSNMRLRFGMDPEFLEEEILHSFEVKEYHTATTAFEKLTKIEGIKLVHEEETLKKVALAYYYLSRFDQCIETYKKLIELFPDKEDYHYNIALAYVKKSENMAAIDHVKSCIKLNPKDARFHMLLGKLANEVGDHSLATASYEQVVKIDPSNISLLRDLKRG